jgi:phosphoenolpyruvate synthase/pyruvate phosphate dikinase
MFFDGDRITAMREMILAGSEGGRRTALAKLLPMQRSDFIELFEIMKGLPVTIRLLDPPLHEFLPKTDEEIAEVAGVIGVSVEKLTQRVDELHEFNPMLGHRGCRLAISYPEIAEMQARAIFEAAVEAAKSTGAPVVPEIMVPLVGLREELDFVKARIDAVAREVIGEAGVDITYLVGTMIELPRAAIRAHAIAEVAEFFSFGTNDLTQTTFGISRDDASSFLMTYQQKGIIEQDPVRHARYRRRRRTGAHRIRQGQGNPARHQARHLRRAWRRPGLGPVLRIHRARLCQLLALPRADRPPWPQRRRPSRKPALPDPGFEDSPKTWAEEKANLSREIPVPIFRNFGEE